MAGFSVPWQKLQDFEAQQNAAEGKGAPPLTLEKMQKWDKELAAKNGEDPNSAPATPLTLAKMRQWDAEDAAKANGVNPASSGSSFGSDLLGYGKAAVAGLGDVAQDALNLPKTLGPSGLQALTHAALGAAASPLSDVASSIIARNIQRTPAVNLNMDARLGLKDPSLGQSLTEGFFHYAPYAFGGEELGADKLGTLGEYGLSKIPGVRSISLKNPLVGAVYGAMTNPNNPTGGIGEGAALGAASDLMPAAIGKGGQALDYIRPGNYLSKMLTTLGGGKTLEENVKGAAQDISSSFKNQREIGKGLYNNVFEAVPAEGEQAPIKGQKLTDAVGEQESFSPNGNNFTSVDEVLDHFREMVPEGDNVESAADLRGFLSNNYGLTFKNNNELLRFFNESPTLRPDGQYSRFMTQDMLSKLSGQPEIFKAHVNYMNNPTFANAHILQSELGSLQRQFKNVPLGIEESGLLKNVSLARTAIKNDISTFLKSKGGNLAENYQNASQHWYQNVSPYLANKSIYKIATGQDIYPKNINTLFAKPQEYINTIVGHVGDSLKNKILYNELGKYTPSSSPENFLRAAGRLDEKGLGSYVSDALHQEFEKLGRRVLGRNAVQGVAGALMGGALGHRMAEEVGMGVIPELAGGAGLGALAPAIANKLDKALPLSAIKGGIAKGAKKAYRPLTRAIMGTILPESSQ